jgi:hypothetical protein
MLFGLSLFSLMQLSATGQGAAGPLSLSACRKGAFLVFSDDRHHTTTGIGGSVYKSPHPATPSFSTSPQQHTPHLHPVPFLSCASARRLKKVECETDRRKGLEKNKKSKRRKISERGMDTMMGKRQQQQEVAVRQRQWDMEVMKMAMLKHEETFRQQVIKPRNVHPHGEILPFFVCDL